MSDAALFEAPAGDPWAGVPGQERAVAQLRAAAVDPVHAFLFLGPRGSGKDAAARVFAGELLAAAAGDPAEAARHRSLAVADQHPDVVVVQREGARISVGQAAEVIRMATLKPIEGARKVMILDEFHLVAPDAAAKLLKTIEEPPPGTFLVVLADDITDELVTIASRCVQVAFPALQPAVVAEALQAEGLDPATAEQIAGAAHGDLDRARLLASDERAAVRLAAWAAVPARLDGRGATVAEVVAELRSAIDDAAGPLEREQQVEVEAMNERIERYGQRGSGAKVLEERHRRQLRRLRIDELRMGLGELAHVYRRVVVGDPPPDLALDVDGAAAALDRIWVAIDALVRNPSEELFLQALLLDLSPTPTGGA